MRQPLELRFGGSMNDNAPLTGLSRYLDLAEQWAPIRAGITGTPPSGYAASLAGCIALNLHAMGSVPKTSSASFRPGMRTTSTSGMAASFWI